MFRIEIEQDEDLVNLVALMARHLGVEYRETVAIETEDRRLADAVGALTRQVVMDDGPDWKKPIIDGWDRLLEEDSRRPEPESVSVSAETPAADSEVPKSPKREHHPKKKVEDRICRYCGDPVGPRAKVCEKKECKAIQTREWNERYEAKRLAKAEAAGALKAAESQPAEEVKAEPPFEAGKTPKEPFYRVPSPEGLKAMTFAELMLGNQAGQVPNGTRVQAQPSGRFYVVRDGSLAAAGAVGAVGQDV